MPDIIAISKHPAALLDTSGSIFCINPRKKSSKNIRIGIKIIISEKKYFIILNSG